VKDRYKLIYYQGYEALPGKEPYYELYDFIDDPQEMEDLYARKPDIAAGLVDELQRKLKQFE